MTETIDKVFGLSSAKSQALLYTSLKAIWEHLLEHLDTSPVRYLNAIANSIHPSKERVVAASSESLKHQDPVDPRIVQSD